MTSTWLPFCVGLIPGALVALVGHYFFVWTRRLALPETNILGWVILLLLTTAGGIVLQMGLTMLPDLSLSYKFPSAIESGSLLLLLVALTLFLGGVHAYGSRMSFLRIAGAIMVEIVAVPFLGYCFQQIFQRVGSQISLTLYTGLGAMLFLLLLFRVGDRSVSSALKSPL